MTDIGNSKVDKFDLEHYRNIFKSVYNFNPKQYPETNKEYYIEMDKLLINE